MKKTPMPEYITLDAVALEAAIQDIYEMKKKREELEEE